MIQATFTHHTHQATFRTTFVSILAICQLLPRSIWRFPRPCFWAWMDLAPRAPGPCCASFRQTCAPCRQTLRSLGRLNVNSPYFHKPPPSCMAPLFSESCDTTPAQRAIPRRRLGSSALSGRSGKKDTTGSEFTHFSSLRHASLLNSVSVQKLPVTTRSSRLVYATPG
jgi:hypothetical protein